MPCLRHMHIGPITTLSIASKPFHNIQIMCAARSAPPVGNEHFDYTPHFNSVAQQYDYSSGGCMHDVASYLVSRLPAPTADGHIHDNAAGTGIVTQTLLQTYSSVNFRVTATDASTGMIDVLREKFKDHTAVTPVVMDSTKLKFPDETFELSYTTFGIFLFPDADMGAREIYRTLKTGGTAAVTVWQSVGWVPVLRRIEKKLGLEPKLLPIDMEKWMDSEYLKQTLLRAGFEDVTMETTTAYTAGDDLTQLADKATRNPIVASVAGVSKEMVQKMMEEVLAEGDLIEWVNGRPGYPMIAHCAFAKK